MASSVTVAALHEIEHLDREIASVLEDKGFTIQSCEITVKHGGRMQLYLSYSAEETSLSDYFFIYGDMDDLEEFMVKVSAKLRTIKSVEQAQIKDATEKVAAAIEAVKDLDQYQECSPDFDMNSVNAYLERVFNLLNGKLLTYEGSTDDTIDF